MLYKKLHPSYCYCLAFIRLSTNKQRQAQKQSPVHTFTATKRPNSPRVRNLSPLLFVKVIHAFLAPGLAAITLTHPRPASRLARCNNSPFDKQVIHRHSQSLRFRTPLSLRVSINPFSINVFVFLLFFFFF